ncbi:segregation/condensation protein A [bacterium]|nr:segregation/condensation protein A [bacterium]
MIEYMIHAETFNGPMDLLLDLVRKHEVNVLTLKMLKIIDDFIAFIEKAKKTDLELTTDFLVVASYLVLLKSRLLLPKTQEEEEELIEEVEDLMDMIKKYEIIKNASVELKNFAKIQSKMHFRFAKNAEDYIDSMIIEKEEMGPYILSKKMITVLERLEKERDIVNITREKFDIIEEITKLFEFFKENQYTEFSEISQGKEKGEIVLIFFAILQMAKREFIDLTQRKNFGPIYLKSKITEDTRLEIGEYE